MIIHVAVEKLVVIIHVAVEKLAHAEFAKIGSRQEALQTIFPSLLDICYHPIFAFFPENRVFQQPPLLSTSTRKLLLRAVGVAQDFNEYFAIGFTCQNHFERVALRNFNWSLAISGTMLENNALSVQKHFVPATFVGAKAVPVLHSLVWSRFAAPSVLPGGLHQTLHRRHARLPQLSHLKRRLPR